MKEKMQLFILPFSGGKANQFDAFISDLGDEIKAEAVEYAGHGRRAREPYFTDYNLFMEDVCREICKSRDYNMNFSILGYSIGGLFAYDLIAKDYLAEQPQHLYICACESNKVEFRSVSKLSEEEFWNEIIRLGGVDSKLVENRKFLKLFSKTLRADFNIAEQHQYLESDKKIECKVSVFYSETDTPFTKVKRWQEVCTQPIDYYLFEGNHFFLIDQHENVSKIIKRTVFR